MPRGAAARWGKLGNYDNGWCVCARKLRASPGGFIEPFPSIYFAGAKIYARACKIKKRQGDLVQKYGAFFWDERTNIALEKILSQK